MQVLHIACVILVLQMIETIQFQEEDDRNRMETLVRRQTSQLPGTSIVSLHIDDIIWMNGERAIESNEAITTNAMDALIISSSLKCIQQLSVTFVNTLPFAVFDDFDPIQSSSNPCIVTRYSSTFPSTSNQVHSPFCVLRSNVHAQKLTIKDEQTISKIDNPSAYQYSSPIHVYDCDDTQQSMNSQPVTHSPTFRVTQKHFLLFRPWTPTFSNLILLSILVLALLNACSTKRHVLLYKIAILFLFIITPINGQTSFPFSSLPSNAPTPFPSSYPTIAPTECLEEVKQELDVSTLSNWRQDADPETVGSGTFILGTSADYCYVRKPCIRMKGRTTSGKGDFWVERTLDVSRWRDITIHVKLYTRGLDNDNEYAFIDTQCDTASETQRTETNHNFNGPYSECFFVDVSSCTALTVGIGGHLSGTGDYVYVTYLAIDYTETPDPTLYPTTQPSNAPSSSPTPAPSFSPSAAPTSAPSEAPTPSTPTTAPTFTDKSVYVSKTGCDYGICNYSNSDYTNLCVNNVPTLGESASYCCHDPSASPSVSPVTAQPTCSSIEYGWNCFLGIGGYPENSVCQDQGYDANGVFNLGAGTWDFPYQIDFDDNNVIIRGSDALSTVLNYIGDESVWVTCSWKKCWIGLEDLTLISNRNDSSDTQFKMTDGGTLSVKNVIFDGENYVQNQKEAFWQFSGVGVTVVFDSCAFYNNGAMYSFLDGVDALFTNCTFSNNAITLNNGSTPQQNAMFYVDNANLIFQDCVFRDNIIQNRSLLYVTNTANIQIINTTFMNNTAFHTNLFQFISHDGDLIMSQSMFTGNQGFQAMIYSDDAANFWFNNDFECVSNSNLSLINISSTSFTDNTNSDYLLYVEGKPTYIDGASIFRDNECTMSCITSIDASLEINGDVITNAPNFMQFMHLNHNATNNITLCIHNNNINSVDVSQYISFLNLNANNAMIKFDNCPAYAPNHSVVFDKTQAIVTENLVYDEPGEKVGKQLNCIQRNADLCQIFCNATVACFGSTFIIDETVSTLHLHCESSYSCQNSMIVSSGIPLPQEASLHIICDADSSCEATEIILTNIDHFRLDCITPESCIDARINLSSTITSEVNCYELNACDDMEIHTDNDNTTLTLHEYSSNVLISNPVGYNQNNLNCGSDDAYFTLAMEDTLSQSITNSLYPQIPCSDVVFICNDTNTEGPSKSCEIETLIIDDTTANMYVVYQCYGPIAFQDVVQLQCLGTCPQSPTTDPTAAPSSSPTISSDSPTSAPFRSPSSAPSNPPSHSPTDAPTLAPTLSPTMLPSSAPSLSPTLTPTLAPTILPTSSPSLSPTLPPTPQCPTIFITVVQSPDAFKNEDVFNGLYTYYGVSTNGFPIWHVPQSNNKHISYDTMTSSWIINGIVDNQQLSLSTTSSYPPMDDRWSHSRISGKFHVHINCIQSYSPTNTPSNAPTRAPSSSPTSPPSIAPTSPPTNAPTFLPSSAPTSPPTLTPTLSPTDAPSSSPTVAPSNSPSFSPTNAPTYNPVSSDDFARFMEIEFMLINVDDNIKTRLGQNAMNETGHILDIIKDEYVFNGGPGILHQDFMLQPLSVQGVDIADVTPRTAVDWTNKKKLKFSMNTECIEFACASIKQQSREENDLDDFVTDSLQKYYANDELQFRIQNENSLEILLKDHGEDDINWALYGMSAICGLFIVIAFGALLFNKTGRPKLPGSNGVDDAKWTAAAIFSLQLWDFYSDINLAVEIWNTERDLDASHNMLLNLSSFGSIFFVLVPYIVNLVVAARIKHAIRHNRIAENYFQINTAFFSILVVITGGCYPALALVSSRIFGLAILSSGVTQYELKQMGRIKVFGTVVLENIPQLVCQGLYAYSIGNTTQAVALACIASLLSITATTLSFLIARDTYSKVVQYYLSLECMDRDDAGLTDGSDDDEMMRRMKTTQYAVTKQEDSEDEEGHIAPTGHERLRTQTGQLDLFEQHVEQNAPAASQLSKPERKNIVKRCGLTAELGKHLAECFKTPPKMIELGCSVITEHGLIIHVVHYVNTNDIAILKDQNINITPDYFVKQLYLELEHKVEIVLRHHFNLNEDFRVQYHRTYPGHVGTLSTGFPTPGGAVDNTDSVDDSRHEIVKRMATRIEQHDAVMNSGYHEAKSKELAAFLVNCGHDEATIKQDIAEFYAASGHKRHARMHEDNYSRQTRSDVSENIMQYDEDVKEQEELGIMDISVIIRDQEETVLRRGSVTNDNEALTTHLEMAEMNDNH